MVYFNRMLRNNIKEYTPTWFKTIPYEQTVKPTFCKLVALITAQRGRRSWSTNSIRARA